MKLIPLPQVPPQAPQMPPVAKCPKCGKYGFEVCEDLNCPLKKEEETNA